MKQQNLLTTMLLLFALIAGSTSAWADYEELYTADFTSVATHSYTQNKTFDLNEKSWKASVSQVNGGVFYLGCNSGNAAKGVLNNNTTFSSVVTALCDADETYNSNKNSAHAYALLFDNEYSDVTKVSFDWAGGNNAFQVYLFGNSGSGYVLLASTNYSTSGTSVAGNVEWTGNATSFTGFAIVARPGTTSSTATSKTLRAASFNLYKTATDPSDTRTATTTSITVPGGFKTDLGGSTNVTAGTLTATVEAGGTAVSGAIVKWESSDETVATIGEDDGVVTLKAVGTTTIKAKYAGDTDYKDSEGTYELTVINSKAPGTQDNPYTVAQAIAATPSTGTSANVYIKGIVSKFYGSSANIMDDGSNYRYYISDDGTTTNTNQLLVYNGKGLNNVAFSDANDLLIGDEIVIFGGLTTYQSTKEVAKDNYIVSLTRLSSIALSGTYTTEFVEGSTFNHDGVVVTATYSDSSTKDVTTSATFSEPNMNIVGEQTITVTYQGKTATYDITITAAPTYTATFSVNGTTSTADFQQNTNITFPPVTDVAGMKFMGWTDAAIVGTQADAPSTLLTNDIMGNGDKTYYAVFAIVTGDATPSLTKLGSDATFSANDNIVVVANCDATHIYAMYQDNASATDYVENYEFVNNAATINSDNKNYWTLTSNGDNWYLGDDTNGYLYTSGSNNLSVSTSSKTSWSISWNETQSAFRIQGSGRYLSCRSDLTSANKYLYRLGGETGSSGKSYFDIYKLTTGSVSYSDYCTTVPTTGTITLNAACNEGGIIYGTFYTNRAYVMHDDLVGSVVSVDNDGKLTVGEVYDGSKGDVVPANTALLISTADEFTGTKNYTITYTNEDGDDYSDYNMLKGTLTADEETEGTNCLFYRLTMHNGTTIGFWWGAENGAAFKPGANKAYLAVPNSQAQNARGFAFDNEATGIAELNAHNSEFIINNSDAVYNLNGQRIAQPTKGLYIVGGRKVMVK